MSQSGRDAVKGKRTEKAHRLGPPPLSYPEGGGKREVEVEGSVRVPQRKGKNGGERKTKVFYTLKKRKKGIVG